MFSENYIFHLRVALFNMDAWYDASVDKYLLIMLKCHSQILSVFTNNLTCSYAALNIKCDYNVCIFYTSFTDAFLFSPEILL